MLSRMALLTLGTAMAISLAACSKTTTDQAATEPAAVTNDVNSAAMPSDANMAEVAAAAGAGTGETCGGIANVQCGSAKDYCKQPVGQCGSTADGAGKCTAKPEICTKEYVPVCGCDGKTYGNACEAGAAGVSVQSPGECKKP